MLMAPVLTGCRIDSLQLDANTVVGGGLIRGAVRISPTCQLPFLEGLLRLEVVGSHISPGIEVEASRELRETIRFTARTTQVATPTATTLTARLIVPLPLMGSVPISSASAPLTLMPPLLGGIEVPRGIQSAGGPQQGRLLLTRPAPAGGAEVLLESSMPTIISLPPSVVVPEGMTEATFPITPVAKLGGSGIAPVVQITAFHAGTRREAETILLPLLVTAISVAPNPVVGGGMPVDVTLRFNASLIRPETVRVQVGEQATTASLARRQTFTVTVPTDRPGVPAGQRVTLPISVTIGGLTFRTPTTLEVLSAPQPGLSPQILPQSVLSAQVPREIGLTRFFMT